MNLIHISVVAVALLVSISSQASRNVCTITINSSDEKQIFQSQLRGGDFKFIELTDFANQGNQSSSKWMENACNSGISCDVLIISGHFGGTFFGSNDKNLSLSSSEMERLSCNKSCDGIMKNPKEVFLFGCNTLASKEKDHRTPEQYRRVLLDDNIPPNEVERIVQARYGALGASYKDQMRRIFPETTIIHGFDSVGPSGKTVRPFLEKFFKNSGSYNQRIQKLEGQKIVDLIEKSNSSLNDINAPMSNAMTGTAYTWCSGIGNDEKASRIKKNICGLFQKTTSGAVVAIRDMLKSEDRTIYLMAINEFFKNYKGSDSDIFKSFFGKDQNLKKELTELAKSLENSSAGVAFDVHETMYYLGFVSDQEREKKLKSHVLQLLNTSTRESIDLAVSTLRGARGTYSALSYNDLGSSIKTSPYLAEVLSVLNIKDSTGTKAALQNIRNLNDENFVTSMIYASTLPGASEEKVKSLEKLNRINSNKLPHEKRKSLADIKKGLTIQLGKDPKKVAKDLSEIKEYNYAVTIINSQSEDLLNRGVYEHLFNDPTFINKIKSTKDGSSDHNILINLVTQTSLKSKGASKVVDAALQQTHISNNLFSDISSMTVRNDELTSYFIENLNKFDFTENSKLSSVAQYIKNTKLTETQKNNLKRKIDNSQYKDSYLYTFGNALN